MIRCEKRVGKELLLIRYALLLTARAPHTIYKCGIGIGDRDCLLHSQDCYLRNMQGLLLATLYYCSFNFSNDL